MYATLALGLDGKPIPLDFDCAGDGSPDSTCGQPLFFSFDEVDKNNPDFCHRYASCKNRHTWSFTFPTVQRRYIKVSEIGVPTFPEATESTSKPDHPRVHVGIMTDDEDEFLRRAPEVRAALAEKIGAGKFLVKQAASPPPMTRRQRRTLQRQRLKEAKKKGLL